MKCFTKKNLFKYKTVTTRSQKTQNSCKKCIKQLDIKYKHDIKIQFQCHNPSTKYGTKQVWDTVKLSRKTCKNQTVVI